MLTTNVCKVIKEAGYKVDLLCFKVLKLHRSVSCDQWSIFTLCLQA